MYIYIVVNDWGRPIAAYDCLDKAALVIDRYYGADYRIKRFPILTNFLQKDNIGA